MKQQAIVLLLCFACAAHSKVFFKEQFDDGDEWNNRWVQTNDMSKSYGSFELSGGKFYHDRDDMGIKTEDNARFYGLTAPFPPFSNEDSDLVIQYQVKHEQGIDCGGGYVKLFGSKVKPEDMNGDSPYNIMFGPDICGSDQKIHVIFNYKGVNHELKEKIPLFADDLTHLYTLVVYSNNQSFAVKYDGNVLRSAFIEDEFNALAPKKILDPEAKKPEEWDERETIPDPEAEKPENWDQPQMIIDESVVKPEDWDEDIDGEWEQPIINNPEYKGVWKPKQVPNPDYNGVWIHPEIDNPDYQPDASLGKYKDIASLGLDLWQVKAGSIFDNFIITDSEAEADQYAKATFHVLAPAEKKMKEQEAAKFAEEKKQAEQAKEEEEEEDDETHDEL